MVCNRCETAVKLEMEKLGLDLISVELGEVEVQGNISANDRQKLAQGLSALGFELVEDKKTQTITRIKSLIIELVHYHDNELKITLSNYLSDRLNLDYTYISNLFSEVEGITIERYFIAQKIEKVKELLVYDELSLSEIAYRLNYSSVAYLSYQFKKITSLTPTEFKKLKGSKRTSLDKV